MDDARNREPRTAREYLRVSKDASGRLRSTDEQRKDHARRAADLGVTQGDPYVEEDAISASRFTTRMRRGFAALIGDLASGEFRADILQMWESSRGSRQVREWVDLIDLCQKNHVLIDVYSHGRTYDPANPRDRRTLLEDAVDSEYESAKMSGRIKRALAANVVDGRPHGKIPYGYRREYALTQTGRRLLVGQFRDPVEGVVVEWIFAQLGAGRSLRAITADLNETKAPTRSGKPWKEYTVRAIGVNPAYAGKRSHFGELTDASWEPIVRPEVFWPVHDLLTDPGRRTSRPGRAKHLLSRIATCAVCDGPMMVRFHHGAGHQAEYWCARGNHLWIPCTDLDTYIVDLLAEHLARPGTIDSLTPADNEGQVRQLRDDLAGLRARHAEMTAAMAAGRMSVGAFTAAEPKVLADITAAETSIRRMQVPASVLQFLTPGIDLHAVWDTAELAAKRDLVRTFFDAIKIARPPAWKPGRHNVTPVILVCEAPDGTEVHCEGSIPYEWAGLEKVAGEWTVVARGRTPELQTARRYARQEGRSQDWVVVPLQVDSQVLERVTTTWRGEPA